MRDYENDVRDWWDCPCRFVMEYAERVSGGYVTSWRVERGGVPRLVFNIRPAPGFQPRRVVLFLSRLEWAFGVLTWAERKALMPEKVA